GCSRRPWPASPGRGPRRRPGCASCGRRSRTQDRRPARPPARRPARSRPPPTPPPRRPPPPSPPSPPHPASPDPPPGTAAGRGATIRAIPVLDDGRLDLSALDDLLTERTRVVALAHVSNVLGTVNPVREVAQRANSVGAAVVVDGAQAVAHRPVDVRDLGVDL